MANKNRYDDLHTGTIAYATLVSCIVLLVTILGVRALCCAWVEGEEERKMADAHYVSSDQTISEQKARLAGYQKQMVEVIPTGPAATEGESTEAAAPKMEERIHIPIQRAKDLLMKEMVAGGESKP